MKNFDSNNSIILSCNDRCIVKIVELGCPLELCPKIKTGWLAYAFEFIAADHDTFAKFMLVPTNIFDIDIPNNPNLGSFFNGDAYVGVKESVILPNFAFR